MSWRSSKRKAMEMVSSHSLRRLSTASALKMAPKCWPIVMVCNFKKVLCSNDCFLISSFKLYFIDTHIYLSFNISHLIEKWKTIVLLHWWLMSHNQMWITLPILPSHNLHTMHHKLTSNISMSRGLICAWTKEMNLGKQLFIFRKWKDIWGCLKNLQFCELRYPMCIICIRRGTNIAIEANVRTIT